jgi:hypothetical protein
MALAAFLGIVIFLRCSGSPSMGQRERNEKSPVRIRDLMLASERR